MRVADPAGWSCLIWLFLKFFIFPFESFNPACRINQFLFACKKRMAFGTNFNPDILFGGADLDLISAGAFDGRFMIFWMDIAFHCYFNPLNKIYVFMESKKF